MKVLIASAERFAGCLIDSLLRHGHEVVGVISPSKGVYGRGFRGPRTWGYRLRGWDMLPLCSRRNIEFRISRQLEDGAISAFIKSRKPDLLLLFSWPTKVSERTTDLFPLGGMNIHPSLLPRLRGADPLFHIVEKGDAAFGLTFHKVVPELDAGPIYHKVALTFAGHETYDDLYFRLIDGLPKHLPEALKKLQQNPAGTPQEGEDDFAIRFRQSFRLLDPKSDWRSLQRRSRACYSHHTQLTLAGGQLIHFSGIISQPTRDLLFPRPGTIQKVNLFSIDVNLGGVYVTLKRVRIHGKTIWTSPLKLALSVKAGDRLEPVDMVKQKAKSLDEL